MAKKGQPGNAPCQISLDSALGWEVITLSNFLLSARKFLTAMSGDKFSENSTQFDLKNWHLVVKNLEFC